VRRIWVLASRSPPVSGEAGERAGSEPGAGGVASQHTVKDAGADRLVESGRKHRLMFFGDGNKDTTELNGRIYPHPALVFMLNAGIVGEGVGRKPAADADTRLKNAPYWNTDAQGRVCLGSMRVPEEVGAGSLSGWDDAYFASEFTHPSGAVHLTPTAAGFLDSGQSWQGEIAVSSQASCRCEPNAAGVCAETGEP